MRDLTFRQHLKIFVFACSITFCCASDLKGNCSARQTTAGHNQCGFAQKFISSSPRSGRPIIAQQFTAGLTGKQNVVREPDG